MVNTQIEVLLVQLACLVAIGLACLAFGWWIRRMQR